MGKSNSNGNGCTVKHAALLGIMVTILLTIVGAAFVFSDKEMTDCQVRLRTVEGACIRVDEKLANIEKLTKVILDEMKGR